MVCKVLSLVGIAAQQFTDPVAFLVEIKRSQPPLVILDLALGQSDAVDVIRKLDVLKYSGMVLLISGRDEATLAEIERIGRSHGLWMAPSLHLSQSCRRGFAQHRPRRIGRQDCARAGAGPSRVPSPSGIFLMEKT